MGFHDELSLGDIHIPYNWSYADQSSREAATGFESGDLGRLARQTDNNSLWMLVAVTPTWVGIGDGGGSSDASRVVVSAKKASAGTINKGQAVYIAGYSGGFVLIELAKADSSSTMPAVGVANATITDSAEGQVVAFGKVADIDTSSWSINDGLYVSAGTAGLLTDTRPTGATSLIQLVARVSYSHASAGIIAVMGAGRTNALPNLTEDKIWVGDSNGQPAESDFLVFGTQYQYVASDGESSNGTTTPVQKVRLTTPVVPAGTYHIEWTYEYQRDDVANDFIGQVEVDDTTVINTHNTEVKDVASWHPAAGFADVALTNAAHTIDIDFWGETSTDTSYIRRARISIWRVS